jgi:HD superfamily phosphohydrolase
MDDASLRVSIREEPACAPLGERLSTRELYKRAVWTELDAVPERVVDADHEAVRDLERGIAERAGVGPDAVILDVPDRPRMRESTARVLVGGEARPLDEQSPLVAALREAQRRQWRLGVYAPATATAAVGEAASTALDLDVDGPLVAERGDPYRAATLADFE